MLIGIAGPACSGKKELARWLQLNKSFTCIRLIVDNHSIVDGNADINNNQSETAEIPMTLPELNEFILEENRWKDNYCVYPIEMLNQLEQLRKRPFFWLVAVDAPVLYRFQRSQLSSLQQFLELTELNHLNSNNVFIPQRHADMFLYNAFESTEAFHYHCSTWFDNHLKIPPESSSTHLRPSWDDYFMLLADLAAYRSNCMKRRVGCILVKNFRVISTGYNGTPRGTINCCDGGCNRCNQGAKCGQNLAECLCLHAEENALLEAGRERIDLNGRGDDGVILYCNTCPCLSCAKKIVQCGVHEVVYKQKYGMDEMTRALFKQVNIRMRQFQPKFQLHICSESTASLPMARSSS